MKPFYLYSKSNVEMAGNNELEVVESIWGKENTSTLITDIPKGSTVIPRFRSIPFGEELEQEIKALGSTLINSHHQHRNIANLYNWVNLLEGLTAPAYRIDEIPNLPEGEYFIKGETNSIKNNWFEKAYAATKADVIKVALNVLNDQYVGNQEIVIRPYQKFRKLTEAVDGRPVFHERRVFVLNGQVISDGFYWSSFIDEIGDTKTINPTEYKRVLDEAISRISHLAPFVVIDLAEYEDGSWGVVELNDACQSGLSENNPEELWSNFKNILK